ncbi:MAG: LytR/AlgR family response regulator transcription factor [Flammeovirgaceae bacterium]
MIKLHCLIVDDESIARKGLEKYAQQIPFLNLRGLCKSALQAHEYLLSEQIDLLFLDINMPGIKGTDFLRSLQQAPYVVFTTAYSEYALESFEFDVVDYLVKPIAFERFLQAANKALRMIHKTTDESAEEQEFFYAKSDGKLIRIYFDDIYYVESAQNYVTIYMADQQHMVLITLKAMLELLPAAQFIQVHRSCIVAKAKVNMLDGNQLVLGKYQVPVSRRMRDEVYQRLFKDKIIGK